MMLYLSPQEQQQLSSNRYMYQLLLWIQLAPHDKYIMVPGTAGFRLPIDVTVFPGISGCLEETQRIDMSRWRHWPPALRR